MKNHSKVILLILSVMCLGCSLAFQFPRHESAAVVALMDLQHGTNDLAGHNDLYENGSYAIPRPDLKGPFGELKSCWGVTQERSYLCKYYGTPIIRTMAFYLYTPANQSLGAIFRRFLDFNVNYNQTDLEFKGSGSNHIIELTCVVKDFLVPNAWNFVAFTDDGTELKVYNEQGSIVETFPSFAKYQIDDYVLYIGRYYDFHTGYVYMSQDDALACIYVYNATLTGEEIRQIPESCKFKGNPQLEEAWPQHERLAGLWPLSSQYGSKDISGNELEPTEPDGVDEFTVGPQGGPDAAAFATKANSPLIKIKSNQIGPTGGSFTVAMWLAPQSGQQSGALFEFLDELGTTKAFQFHYNGSNIDFSANGIAFAGVSMVQPSGTWTFVAVTLENSVKLTVFGDQGMVALIHQCLECADSLESSIGGLALGHTARWGDFIQVGDAVSCLALYNKALTGMELRQLKDSCRIVNFAALSGQPRLPLSPIPDISNPTKPKIPSNGQFPWLGSLQYKGNHICSATIVNSLWVLTSATCVVEDQSGTNYRFMAATYDLEVSYEQQQHRDVKAISVSGISPWDLALLELSEPLDMTSDYVNDAYIARGDEVYTNWLKEQLFVGWGINGRSEFDSPTLPRYVAGTIMTDEECEQLWPGDYSWTFDFCFRSLAAGDNVPCHGDEGSPVLVQTDGDVDVALGERLIQVGVYRGRDANCTVQKPGLFTRTSRFSEWISSVVDHV